MIGLRTLRRLRGLRLRLFRRETRAQHVARVSSGLLTEHTLALHSSAWQQWVRLNLDDITDDERAWLKFWAHLDLRLIDEGASANARMRVRYGSRLGWLARGADPKLAVL